MDFQSSCFLLDYTQIFIFTLQKPFKDYDYSITNRPLQEASNFSIQLFRLTQHVPSCNSVTTHRFSAVLTYTNIVVIKDKYFLSKDVMDATERKSRIKGCGLIMDISAENAEKPSIYAVDASRRKSG